MKIAFIITSVIRTSSVNWTYAQRSAYSPEQRYEQSLESIASIRQHVPDADMYFVEGSEIPEYMINTIKSQVFKFINNHDNEENKEIIHNSPYKGHGEAKQTLEAINEIEKTGIQYDYIFKLSGRYQLGDTFDINKFIHINPTFCMGSDQLKTGSYSTVVYSIPRNRIDQWKESLNDFMNYCSFYKLHGGSLSPFYEQMIPPKLQPINGIHKCGSQGYVAVKAGDFFNCV